jgi:hypothetical protein
MSDSESRDSVNVQFVAGCSSGETSVSDRAASDPNRPSHTCLESRHCRIARPDSIQRLTLGDKREGVR